MRHTTPHLYLSAKRRSESGVYAEDDVRRLDVMRGHGRRLVTCKVALSRPTDRVCLIVGVDEASRPHLRGERGGRVRCRRRWPAESDWGGLKRENSEAVNSLGIASRVKC